MLEDSGRGGRSTSDTPPSYDPYAAIRQLYAQVTGGKYTPTDQELQQWGTNIDAGYLEKIRGAISNWWQQQQASQAPASTPATPAAPAPASPGALPPQPPSGLTGAPTAWAPNPTAPSWTPIPKFTPPSAEEAAKDPGYAFAAQQGEQALQQSQAAQGLTNSGGSLKDILAWGQNYAAQRYGDVFNRAKSVYDTNTQTQYIDPYAASASTWQTQMAATQNQNQFLTSTAMQRWWNDWMMKYQAATA